MALTLMDHLSDVESITSSDDKIVIKKYGRVVELIISTNTTPITTSGIQLPSGVYPMAYITFTGKATYNGTTEWDRGFTVTPEGKITARARDDNSAVEVTWVRAHIVYLTSQ